MGLNRIPLELERFARHYTLHPRVPPLFSQFRRCLGLGKEPGLGRRAIGAALRHAIKQRNGRIATVPMFYAIKREA